ncbi:MAG: hypothetical protein ACRDPI_07415 [Nocardioidaceae bacterium]
MTDIRTPDVVPLLSRGKHRNPRKGACFMEFASFLAGERWSDHPNCTHSLLAALARDINDHVPDVRRNTLLPLVPDVVGLNSEDPHWHAWIAREVALTALPIVSAERQGIAALGLLRSEAELTALDDLGPGHLSDRAASALADAPRAARWAMNFTCPVGARSFIRCSAPAIVHSGVTAIADAAVLDPSGELICLLRRTVELCRARLPVPAQTASPVARAATRS